MDLITRKIIAKIEGVSEVSDELAKEYVNPNSPKYKMMIVELCEHMGFDSLRYHTIEDLIEAIGLEPCKLCTYCFDGKEN